MKKKKKNKPARLSTKTIQGVVDMTSSGNAFVIVPDMKKDIMIFKQDVGAAFHKDLVNVEITRRSETRIYGKIVSVEKRKYTEWTGTVEQIGNGYYFMPSVKYKISSPLMIQNLDTIDPELRKKKVRATIAKSFHDKLPIMEILSASDKQNDDAFILNDILIENGFHLDFPEEVFDYSKNFVVDFAHELSYRKDVRKVFTITIDPADAKDFDDALSIQYLDNGHIEIGIHIADVSHFVQAESAIDKEAKERATSVYMPGFVLPMLPHNLSDNLCSLVPNEDRLTFSAFVELRVNKEKVEIVNTNFSKTVIHSNRRFAYEEVQDIIETKQGDYTKEILDLHDIATCLRAERMKNGAMNFSSTEVRFALNENNFPTAIVIKESKESHQLVEEFMLLANKKVAEFLSKQKPTIAFPYRIHDKPDEKKVNLFIDIVRRSGFQFMTSEKKPFPTAVNELLLAAKQSPQIFVFEKLAIRSMAKAIYTTKNIGHYGLGFQDYTHFTSPIRRYPDILTHRALNDILTKSKPQTAPNKMEEYCLHSSTKEKSATDAERMAIKYKQTQYMSQFVGQQFEAIVTGVASFGFWAETILHKCEGMVKLSDLLLIDDFVYKQEEMCLVGRATKQTFELGKKIMIQVVSAYPEDKELNYAYISNK